jgi:hypothetical protein
MHFFMMLGVPVSQEEEPTTDPSLDFSLDTNSQYIALF